MINIGRNKRNTNENWGGLTETYDFYEKFYQKGFCPENRHEGNAMEFTHFDADGNAIMVDVSEKKETNRTAVAKGRIYVSPETIEAIKGNHVKKGDVLGVARVAGIMAAKKTPDLIPLCHVLCLTKAAVDFTVTDAYVEAVCTVKTTGKTGVEMEALTGVSVALLTVFDMCKAIDKTMEITDIHVVSKEGGKSGLFENPKDKVQ